MKIRHGAIMENVFAYMCAKFGDDRLWNDKALADRKSYKTTPTRSIRRTRTTLVVFGEPSPGLKARYLFLSAPLGRRGSLTKGVPSLRPRTVVLRRSFSLNNIVRLTGHRRYCAQPRPAYPTVLMNRLRCFTFIWQSVLMFKKSWIQPIPRMRVTPNNKRHNGLGRWCSGRVSD